MDAITQALKDQTLIFSAVDDRIYILAIPPNFDYAKDETLQIAKELQQSFLPNRHNKRYFSVINWSEVVGRSPDEPQLFFFADMTTLRLQIEKAAKHAGHQIRSSFSEELAIAGDGRYEEQIDLVDLVSTAIFDGIELDDMIANTAKNLRATFRLFRLIERSLPKHFKDSSFWMVQGQMHALNGNTHGEVSYRNIAKALNSTGLDLGAWLNRINFEDLLNLDQPPMICIRSPNYLKARPDSLVKVHQGHLLVPEVQLFDRIKPIKKLIDDPIERLDHYIDESKRFLKHAKYDAYALRTEGETAMALVGDKIASIAAHPELVRAAVSDLGQLDSVRLIGPSEDILVIANSNSSWQVIEKLLGRAQYLCELLNPDGADSLHLDFHMRLPRYPKGVVNVEWIPEPFFLLIETATTQQRSLAPGKADYLRGLAFEIIHRPELATKAYQTAYRHDRTDGDVNHALGRTLVDTRQLTTALPFLERAFELLPKDAEVANTLGLAYLESQQNSRAIVTLEHAVRLAPLDVQLLTNLGRCYFAGAKLKEAETVLQKALQYAPNFSTAHATLAQIRWRLGDLGAARQHARRAFAADPANKSVQDLLWALNMNDK